MTRKLIAVAAVALLGVLSARSAAAQAQNCSGNPCSLNNTASVTVATVLRLDLSSSATALTPPDINAYNAGFQLDNGPSATVKSNRPWTLKISASAGTWTAANGANAAKAAGDLQWATTSGGSYSGLTTSPASVLTGTGTAGTAQSIFYKALWSYANDTPGDYSLVVVYTLTAP
jgi:hypothetical protein